MMKLIFKWPTERVIVFVCLVSLGILVSCDKGTSVPIPTGGLDDVMKDQPSFYRIRGGSDYDRLPLRYGDDVFWSKR
jgi:hypothetical protein